ncbi:hypothetical protein HJG60_010718 [Phyllostomus discolor]|uniref:Uncharacterized protein n=1 Tax=Phyllostomus discolor TaxID=89673 RepID=A0A834AHZ7_9CHIR|nr:hypothetical protein HJG60_010718 [Phyllostomus discolor]
MHERTKAESGEKTRGHKGQKHEGAEEPVGSRSSSGPRRQDAGGRECGQEPGRQSLGGSHGPGRRVDIVQESPRGPQAWGRNCVNSSSPKAAGGRSRWGWGPGGPACRVPSSSALERVCLNVCR